MNPFNKTKSDTEVLVAEIAQMQKQLEMYQRREAKITEIAALLEVRAVNWDYNPAAHELILNVVALLRDALDE